MVILAALTFAYNGLCDYLTGLVNVGLPAYSTYVLIAAILASFPLAFLRVWTNGRLKAILYLSWALYLPSALYFSGFDPLRILSVSVNFSVFSSKLPTIAIGIIGLALACGSLMSRSFMYIRDARENFLARGADKGETYGALYQNAIFEIKVTVASAAVVLLIMAGVPFVEHDLLGVMKSAGFVYIVAGLGAVVMMALVFFVFLWPRKTGEKG